MSEKPPSDVLGALPHTRPHRRSDKRKAAAAGAAGASPAPGAKPTPKAAATTPKTTAAKRPVTTNAKAKLNAATPDAPIRPVRRPRPERLRQPAQPEGTPDARRSNKPPGNGIDLVGTAVQAAAELAEIGISVSARAIRRAVSRLPRP